MKYGERKLSFRETVSILPFASNLSSLRSNLIIPAWLRGNLGQIWRFVIPWNPRWILVKSIVISEQLFSACHFLEEKCSFLTLCSRSNTLVPEAFFYTIFFICKFATRSADRSTEPERKESLWSRSLRISLSCWLSTWQLSKMSFSFNQSQRRIGFTICWQGRVGQFSVNHK